VAKYNGRPIGVAVIILQQQKINCYLIKLRHKQGIIVTVTPISYWESCVVTFMIMPLLHAYSNQADQCLLSGSSWCLQTQCVLFAFTSLILTASLKFTHIIHADLLKQFSLCAFQQLKLFYKNHNLTFNWLKHTHIRFTALFLWLSGWPGARRKLLLDFMVQRKITEADTPIIRLGATQSRLISDPPPTIPPFLRWMPFLPQPSHFMLAWYRHQICWLVYPVAWFLTGWKSLLNLNRDLNRDGDGAMHLMPIIT